MELPQCSWLLPFCARQQPWSWDRVPRLFCIFHVKFRAYAAVFGPKKMPVSPFLAFGRPLWPSLAPSASDAQGDERGSVHRRSLKCGSSLTSTSPYEISYATGGGGSCWFQMSTQAPPKHQKDKTTSLLVFWSHMRTFRLIRRRMIFIGRV